MSAPSNVLHHLFNPVAPCSAGQTGPVTSWFEDPKAPQHESAETLGRALFDAQSFEDWGTLYNINAFSVFFATTAFLGLLAKGSEDVPGWTSSVVNITSVSGLVKLAQNHVRATPKDSTMNTHTDYAISCSSPTIARKLLRRTCRRCSRRSSR